MAVTKNLGAFIPTAQVWDIGSVRSMDVKSDAFKELIVHLYQNMNSIATLLNLKDTGQYPTEEFVCGKQYVLAGVTHQVFRKVIDFGALPNAATTSVLHNITITNDLKVTEIYGASTDPGAAFIPLPYSSPTLVENIELKADSTHVIVTTGDDRSGFTETLIVIEFIKF